MAETLGQDGQEVDLGGRMAWPSGGGTGRVMMPRRGPNAGQEDADGHVSAYRRRQIHSFHKNPSAWPGLASRTALIRALPLQS